MTFWGGELRTALESAYGLALGSLSDAQLEAAARSAGLASLRDEAGLARVVDYLPIEESWLFRNEELWRWLHDELMPPLLAEAWERGLRLRVASVGCSTGQEPFSLAVVLQRLLEAWGVPASAAHHRVEVTGYDCSPARIAIARSGELNAWSVERTVLDWARPRTVALGAGRYRMDDSVRSMCRFEVGNLLSLSGGPWLTGYRLVLCRHALIYFQPNRAAEVVATLGGSLDAGTTLVLGAPEAHLVQGVPTLEPLPHLGAARVRSTPLALPAAEGPRARPPLRALPRQRTPRTPPAPTPAAPPAPAPVGDRVEDHLRAALAHAAAGREAEALEEARRACSLRPDDLTTRLVLAQALSAVDEERGRAALRDLLDSVGSASADAGLASAPELSLEQVAAAARLLLAEKGR